MAVDAEKLYAAFRSIVAVDDDGALLPALDQIPDKGRGWFAIANAIEAIAAPPTDMVEPYEIDLAEIPPRLTEGGEIVIESPDERPTKMRIRPFTADDLCTPHYGSDRYAGSILARATGIDLNTIEWRMDPGDVEGGIWLCNVAAGLEAADLCKRAYFDGGGEQAIEDAPGHAWSEVAQALLTTIEGEVAHVRCRTPGIGTLRIGPIRYGHLRMYRGARAESEWKGRLVALAKATDKSVGALQALRIEDAAAAWDAFEALKKKADQRTNSMVARTLSSRSSGDGPPSTSTP